MSEIYDLLDLLAWQKVWDWASSTTLAPYLLSQTPLRDQIERNGQALPRNIAALADRNAWIEQAGEDTADTDRWWYVTVRHQDVAEATRRIVALGYQIVEDD